MCSGDFEKLPYHTEFTRPKKGSEDLGRKAKG